MTDADSYRVLWSRMALDTLRGLRDKIENQEQKLALADVIKTLDGRLRENPLLVGEIYRRKGGVSEHLAAYQLVAIDFAVDAGRKIVVVRHVRPLSTLGS